MKPSHISAWQSFKFAQKPLPETHKPTVWQQSRAKQDAMQVRNVLTKGKKRLKLIEKKLTDTFNAIEIM